MVLRPAGQGALLPELGSGRVYAQSATAVYRFDLRSGEVTRTAMPDLQEHATFLAGRGWVLVKSRWSPTGVVVRDGHAAQPLPAALTADGSLHAGPRGQLWSQPEPGTEPRASTTFRLLGLDGRQVAGHDLSAPRSASPSALVADGYGGLLLANQGGVYRLERGTAAASTRLELASRGALVGTGGRRLLVWDCDARARCHLVLVDQRSGRRLERPAAARTLLAEGGIGIDSDAYGDAQLSPDGSHFAVTVHDGTGRFRVHVLDLATGRDQVLPGAGPDANVNRQLAWTPDARWLLALTDRQVRAYDTRTRTGHDLGVSTDQLLHLTAEHASGW